MISRPVLIAHRPRIGSKKIRWAADGYPSLSVPRSLSQTARYHQSTRLKAACVTYTTGSRVRIAKNVPILRVNHAPGEDVLCGMREVARSGYLTRPLFGEPRHVALK